MTRGIRVQVKSVFVPERSAPREQHYFFAYHVRISNEGDETAQLLSRHWIVTNADGDVQEVRGPGVVGETPILEPGGSFEYTSYCPLTTAVGAMHGTLHHDHRRRRDLRRRDRPVHAGDAQRLELMQTWP